MYSCVRLHCVLSLYCVASYCIVVWNKLAIIHNPPIPPHATSVQDLAHQCCPLMSGMGSLTKANERDKHCQRPRGLSSTQILIKLQFWNLDLTLTLKSQPNISISTKSKPSPSRPLKLLKPLKFSKPTQVPHAPSSLLSPPNPLKSLNTYKLQLFMGTKQTQNC